MTAREKMKAIVADCGTVRAAAERLGLSSSMVQGVISGRYAPGTHTYRALGMTKATPAETPSERRRRELKERLLVALARLNKQHGRPVGTGPIAVACNTIDESALALLKELHAEGRIERVGNRWQIKEETPASV